MYTYPDDALAKLGLDAVRERLRQHALGVEAKAAAAELLPSSDYDALRRTLRQVDEARELLASGETPPLQSVPSVGLILQKARIEGNYVTEEEALRLWRWLELVRRVRSYFQQRAEKYPALGELVAGPAFDTSLAGVIETIVDRDGRMLSTASRTLASIRKSLVDRAHDLRRLLDATLRRARDQGWTDARELTLRNERLVLPLHAEAKNRIPGIVQDVSATGQTVFLEPLEALGLNNELRELRIREQNEVVRILTELTDRIRPQIPAFHTYLDFVTAVDLLLAKARLALEMEARLPALQARPERLELVRARHPLLVLQKGAQAVVPLSLRLDRERRVLLVSGPNAGGKSVALKTVGLLQAMLQCGLLVPCDPDSSFGCFQQLYVDIGDDQSIANDLSTYSSHLTHMRAMLDGMRAQALFLIDEFGTGTDPQLGGPMAEALLERFLATHAFGVVTTHYSNLKDFASRHPHTANAAMQFDSATLQPTFQLLQGMPGSSFTFEMAQRAGIPADIIQAARAKMGESRADADLLLSNLKQREAELQRLLAENARRDRELEGLVRTQKTQLQEAQKKRREIIAEAQDTAAGLIRQANAKIEATIREIREQQADKEATRQLRQALAQEQLLPPDVEDATEAEPTEDTGLTTLPGEVVDVGDYVELQGSGARGRVLERRDKRFVVAFGELRTVVRPDELVKVGQAPGGGRGAANVASVQRNAEAHMQIDLRGQRVDAALTQLDRFMDQALLAGLDQLVVLHGKGSGALRGAVRDHLRKFYPQVQRLDDGPAQGGGDGLTLVYLA